MDHEFITGYLSALRRCHPKMVDIFKYGSCMNLYRLLKLLDQSAVPWSNVDHIITEIGGRYYDIEGEVTDIEGYIPWESYHPPTGTIRGYRSMLNHCLQLDPCSIFVYQTSPMDGLRCCISSIINTPKSEIPATDDMDVISGYLVNHGYGITMSLNHHCVAVKISTGYNSHSFGLHYCIYDLDDNLVHDPTGKNHGLDSRSDDFYVFKI